MPISDNSPTLKIINETPNLTPTFIQEESARREVNARNSERISDQRQDCMITDLSKESFSNNSPPIPMNFAIPIN